MTEKEKTLRQQAFAKQEEIRSLLDGGKVEEAESMMTELRNMRKAIEMLGEVEKVEAPEETRTIVATDDTELRMKAMAKMLRGRTLTEEELRVTNVFKEGEGAKGGFIVPVDALTKINEYKRALNPLENLVRVETVSTMTGTRVYEKLEGMKPFDNISELSEIQELESPTFEQIKYVIKKYAGLLKISNELLADTDQNLTDYVYRWLARKEVTTRNAEIVKLFNKLTKKPIVDADALKDVLNVALDPTISLTSVVVTNQDGFNFLDKLKDKDGNYLLQPDVLDATKHVLLGRPVHVVSNSSFAISEQSAPVVIGDLQEAITLFDRKALTLDASAVAGNAFATDSTFVRGITRFDTVQFDKTAAVLGQVTIG